MYFNFEFDLFKKRSNAYDPFRYVKDDALSRAIEYLEKNITPDKLRPTVDEVITVARTFEEFLKEGKTND